MRKCKVTVAHPMTGEPFKVELETITDARGDTVTGYRVGAGFFTYEKPRKHSAYFQSAEQEERLRKDRENLEVMKEAYRHPIQPTAEQQARHRLSPIETLQLDIDAGNMGAVVERLRKVEADRDHWSARCGELLRLVHALLDAADGRRDRGSESARDRERDGKTAAQRDVEACAYAAEKLALNPRLSSKAIAPGIQRDLADPRSERTIRRAIAKVGRQSADGQRTGE